VTASGSAAPATARQRRDATTATAGKIASGCQTRNASEPHSAAQNQRRRAMSSIETTAMRMPGVLASGPDSASIANPRNDANATAAISPASTEPHSSRASRNTATTVRHAHTKNATRIPSRPPSAAPSPATYAAPGVFGSKMLA